VKKLAALLLAIALLPCALALPPGVTAVEYGMSTCPHCLHMKEVLARMGVPYAFIDVTLSKEDGQEYMRLYGLLVGGGTYYVPFTIFLVNGTAKLAVVGAAEPEQLEALLAKALSSPGILVATTSGGNWTTSPVLNETVIKEVERAVAARTPAVGEVKLVTPFGSPLAYAEVEVACGNETYRAVSGADGKLQLRCKSALLKVLWWRGAPLNYTAPAEAGLHPGGPGRGQGGGDRARRPRAAGPRRERELHRALGHADGAHGRRRRADRRDTGRGLHAGGREKRQEVPNPPPRRGEAGSRG
jgi:glutaredoxin